MKKKLLVIVGAGASIDFGLPSVCEIDELLFKAAFKSWSLAVDSSKNLYGYVRDRINDYYAAEHTGSLRKRTNFEEILHLLYQLSTHVCDPRHEFCSNAFLQSRNLPELWDNGSASQVHGGMLTGLARYLSDVIIDKCVARCQLITTEKAEQLARLRYFLSALSSEFELGFASLNYDNVISHAIPSLFTGFDDDGVFDPRVVFDRREWNFLYHLHGSVHFATRTTSSGGRLISWKTSPLVSMHGQTFGGDTLDAVEGVSSLNSTIVAGYGKPQQILRQPFRTYFAQMQRLVYEADSLLFLGYGFRDAHFNVLFSDVRSRRRPCVVIDYRHDDDYEFDFRLYDEWTVNVRNTLFPPSRYPMFTDDTMPMKRIGDYKSMEELEVCLDAGMPLANWYGGLLSACDVPEKLIAHLL